MKVIDLYLKVNRGKEFPKKVKYEGIIYTYNEDIDDYTNPDYPNGLMGIMDTLDSLNLDVEIIEEDKDIKEVELYQDKGNTLIGKNMWSFYYKINELVREVNKLKNKE